MEGNVGGVLAQPGWGDWGVGFLLLSPQPRPPGRARTSEDSNPGIDGVVRRFRALLSPILPGS